MLIWNGKTVGPFDMTCVTHHFACDCREKKIKEVFAMVLEDHADMRKFLSGFRAAESCKCPVCKAINDLYGDLA